jgi:hypothetical protein
MVGGRNRFMYFALTRAGGVPGGGVGWWSWLRNTIYRVRLGFDSRYIFLDFLLVVTAYNNPDVMSPDWSIPE